MKLSLPKISFREKVMLVALAFVLILIWGSLIDKKYSAASELLKEAEKELSIQKIWLKNDSVFEKKMKELMSAFDNKKMLTASTLGNLVDKEIRSLKLEYELNNPQSFENDLYRENSLQFTLKNASLKQVVSLENKFASHYPLLLLEALAITPNKSDPNLLNVAIRVKSYELL